MPLVSTHSGTGWIGRSGGGVSTPGSFSGGLLRFHHVDRAVFGSARLLGVRPRQVPAVGPDPDHAGFYASRLGGFGGRPERRLEVAVEVRTAASPMGHTRKPRSRRLRLRNSGHTRPELKLRVTPVQGQAAAFTWHSEASRRVCSRYSPGVSRASTVDIPALDVVVPVGPEQGQQLAARARNPVVLQPGIPSGEPERGTVRAAYLRGRIPRQPVVDFLGKRVLGQRPVEVRRQEPHRATCRPSMPRPGGG